MRNERFYIEILCKKRKETRIRLFFSSSSSSSYFTNNKTRQTNTQGKKQQQQQADLLSFVCGYFVRLIQIFKLYNIRKRIANSSKYATRLLKNDKI